MKFKAQPEKKYNGNYYKNYDADGAVIKTTIITQGFGDGQYNVQVQASLNDEQVFFDRQSWTGNLAQSRTTRTSMVGSAKAELLRLAKKLEEEFNLSRQ